MKKTSESIAILLLIIASVFALYPFFVMLLGSFKTPVELSRNPGGLPQQWILKNYLDLYKYNSGALIRSFINSIVITTIYIGLSVNICALAAYAFAKFRFKGRKVIFVFLLSTMMIPGEVLLPPSYLIFAKLKWINTYQVQIIPGIANVFGMFMLRQYMLGIYDSVLESARLDGMGEFGIFRKIAMPMSLPAIGTFLVLQGLGKWNDFLWPAILVNKPEFQPIMVVLPLITTDSNSIFSTPWTLLMAGSTIATLPILILFMIFQDKIMQSVTLGSVKE